MGGRLRPQASFSLQSQLEILYQSAEFPEEGGPIAHAIMRMETVCSACHCLPSQYRAEDTRDIDMLIMALNAKALARKNSLPDDG